MNENVHYRLPSEVAHTNKHVKREGRDDSLSLPSLRQDGSNTLGDTSPRIVYAHRKSQNVQHRSRKQLVQELEAVRRTGSLPGGLEAHVQSTKPLENKLSLPVTEKTKPKHKKSFNFIHNSKFLGRLEARTRREGRGGCEEEVTTEYTATGCVDKTAPASSVQPLPQHQETPSVQSPLPPPPPAPRLTPRSSPAEHRQETSHTPRYHSPSPSPRHHSPAPSSPHSTQTATGSPQFLDQTDVASPPQYSLAAFLNEAFGSNSNTTTTTATTSNSNGSLPKSVKTPVSTTTTPHKTDTQRQKETHTNTGYTEAYNPRYLETSFDSPSDFVIERNYANLLPEIRDIYHHVLLKGKDPRVPLTRTEYGDLELKQNFLGVIGDTIEEEEEEGAESESEIGDLLCQVDSECFERTMEDKLEEMAGKEEVDAECAPLVVAKEEGSTKGRKKTELKLKLMKPENNMVKRVQKSRLLRHISEEGEAINSAGEEEVEVELRTPSTPRSPAIDIDNAFELKHREIDEDTDEMSRLRDLTTRLQLTTRRPSFLDWAEVLKERGKRVGEALATHTPTVMDGREEDQEQEEELSMDRRKHNLQTAVDWVKKELTDMRQQDQQLAKQLLQLRVEVQRLRLLHSCLATSCLLEEVASGAEEAKILETSDLCDLPPDLRDTFSPVLREMGLTRMNITSRRFSLR